MSKAESAILTAAAEIGKLDALGDACGAAMLKLSDAAEECDDRVACQAAIDRAFLARVHEECALVTDINVEFITTREPSTLAELVVFAAIANSLFGVARGDAARMKRRDEAVLAMVLESLLRGAQRLAGVTAGELGLGAHVDTESLTFAERVAEARDLVVTVETAADGL